MILTALNNYYDRLSDQGIEGLPPYGYSNESISYCLQIDTEGNLIDVIPLLDTSGKKPRPSVRMVPNPPKRASNISPCFVLLKLTILVFKSFQLFDLRISFSLDLSVINKY